MMCFDEGLVNLMDFETFLFFWNGRKDSKEVGMNAELVDSCCSDGSTGALREPT